MRLFTRDSDKNRCLNWWTNKNAYVIFDNGPPALNIEKCLFAFLHYGLTKHYRLDCAKCFLYLRHHVLFPSIDSHRFAIGILITDNGYVLRRQDRSAENGRKKKWQVDATTGRQFEVRHETETSITNMQIVNVYNSVSGL